MNPKENIERIKSQIHESYTHLEKGEKIQGGLGDKKPDSDFDPHCLKQGIEIEMEHTTDREVAKEIAKDHLTEDPDYYKKLATIENK